MYLSKTILLSMLDENDDVKLVKYISWQTLSSAIPAWTMGIAQTWLRSVFSSAVIGSARKSPMEFMPKISSTKKIHYLVLAQTQKITLIPNYNSSHKSFYLTLAIARGDTSQQTSVLSQTEPEGFQAKLFWSCFYVIRTSQQAVLYTSGAKNFI